MSAIKTSGRGRVLLWPIHTCMYVRLGNSCTKKNTHNAQENNRKIGKKNAAGIFFCQHDVVYNNRKVVVYCVVKELDTAITQHGSPPPPPNAYGADNISWIGQKFFFFIYFKDGLVLSFDPEGHSKNSLVDSRKKKYCFSFESPAYILHRLLCIISDHTSRSYR